MEPREYVEAPLKYLAQESEKPRLYTYKPPEGVPLLSGKYEKFVVRIHNARAIREELSLDRQGFALTHLGSAVTDFYDDGEVRRVYFPEVERMVKSATGAARVLAFDHNVRSRPRAQNHQRAVQPPVKFVHNDYTVRSGPQRVRDLLADEAAPLLKNRFAFINVWKPITGPVEESPLAVCDARSLNLRDVVIQDLVYRDRVGETYAVIHNPAHRWFYFPRMQRDEAMLIKCFDSDQNRARFTAHSAFDDPASPTDPPPRESIEVRTLVFFPPAQ